MHRFHCSCTVHTPKVKETGVVCVQYLGIDYAFIHATNNAIEKQTNKQEQKAKQIRPIRDLISATKPLQIKAIMNGSQTKLDLIYATKSLQIRPIRTVANSKFELISASFSCSNSSD
eukprot:537246_1